MACRLGTPACQCQHLPSHVQQANEVFLLCLLQARKASELLALAEVAAAEKLLEAAEMEAAMATAEQVKWGGEMNEVRGAASQAVCEGWEGGVSEPHLPSQPCSQPCCICFCGADKHGVWRWRVLKRHGSEGGTEGGEEFMMFRVETQSQISCNLSHSLLELICWRVMMGTAGGKSLNMEHLDH